MTDTGIKGYQGHGFYDAFDKGRSSGELEITESAIQFRTEQAGKKYHVVLPIDGAEITLGGASDRLVFFAHPSHPAWKLYTADRSVLNNPYLRQNPQVVTQLNVAKRTRMFNWSVFAAVFSLIIAIPLCIILFMDSVSAVLAKQIPVEWEQQLGESVFKQYGLENEIMESDEADRLLQPLVEPLLSNLDDEKYKFHISISNDSQVNAFALPGGYLVINSGLILRADNAEEVLGVVAHEISHVTEQHGLRNVISTAGIYLTIDALIGDVSGLLATIASAAPLLINQSYSRGFESEADEKGYKLLTRANVNPSGLASFFEKLIEEEEKRMEQIEDEEARELLKSTMGILSTHPATEERIERLEQLASKNSADYREFQRDFKILKSAVKQFVAETTKSSVKESTRKESKAEESNMEQAQTSNGQAGVSL